MLLDRIAPVPCAPPAVAVCVRAGDAALVPGLMADWAALVPHAAEPNAFAEPWFAAASGLLAGAGDVRLIVVRQGRRLVGLLGVVVAPRYGRLPVAHVQNHLHYHCFLGTPLVRAGQEEPFWGAVLDLLDHARWAPGLFHLAAIVEGGPVHLGLAAAAAARGRPCDVVHRHDRALLQSTLGPAAYYERTVRKKKRKEIRRLEQRLAECGTVAIRRFGAGDDLAGWTDAFLALEGSGWKGTAGSALASRPETAAFFRAALAGAQAAGQLDLLRIDVDGAPVAMLVNFLAAPGAFSFKIAFDEGYARFSPGVLIQIANYAVLDRADIAWMDSCAVENHSMINSLWGERRTLVRLTVPLAGPRRRFVFAACRLAERLADRVRRRRPAPRPEIAPESLDAA